MNTINIAIASVLGLVLLFSLFMLIRNKWVYKARLKMLDKDREKYLQLPTYQEMQWRFWVWDINRFL